MLDMGFVKPIRQAVAMLPAERQTLLFSATMPSAIASLAGSLLTNPAKVEVTPQSTTVDRISQTVMFVDAHNKLALLQMLVKSPQGQPSDRVHADQEHGQQGG